jgi:hypothetical protein
VVLPGESDKLIRRELAARQAAGVKTAWIVPGGVARTAAIASGGAMRLPDAGFVDPFKLTLGFSRRRSSAARRSTKNRA